MQATPYKLPVRAIVDETADTRTFEFDVSPDLSDSFAYKAGQHITVHVAISGTILKRQYSISGNVLAGDPFRITVKRVQGGIVSNWLNENVVVGQYLMIDPPSGRFLLSDSDRDVLLFGAGSGITPLFAIASDALRRTSRNVRLLLVNRNPDSAIFMEKIEIISQRYLSRISVDHHFSQRQGRIDHNTIDRILDRYESGDVYLCGPSGFNELVEESVSRRSSSQFRLSIERFGVLPASLDVAGAKVAHAATNITIVVRLDGNRLVFSGSSAETILEAALAKGFKLPHNCCEGRCGSCLAKLVSGEISMRPGVALSAREKASGYLLACQACPIGVSLEIDFDI